MEYALFIKKKNRSRVEFPCAKRDIKPVDGAKETRSRFVPSWFSFPTQERLREPGGSVANRTRWGGGGALKR